jgi:hypothetical protein
MRLIAAFALVSICACASTNSSSGTTPSTAKEAQSCASPWVPAVSSTNADVFARPDGTSDIVGVISTRQGVCADTSTVGFGYRRVKLPNGREGYVAEDVLTNS